MIKIIMFYILIQWCIEYRDERTDGRTLSIDMCSFIYLYMCIYLYLFIYFRPNSSVPSPPSEINESSSQQTKSGISFNRQTSDELNSQQAKRKFSLSQYKEHKRLKSNEIQSSLADTDMRINNIGNSKVKQKKKLK